jgi:pyruvate formate lyase activating enzyme
VLDTLVYLRHETSVWLEITTLLIPGHNDSDAEITAMCHWILQHLGANVPLHFSAFHPDYKMPDVPATPPATLVRARNMAIREGLNFVYTGNAHHAAGDTTYCPHCQTPLIERDWYQINHYRLSPQGRCPTCQTVVAGRFGERSGNFGRQRIPIRLT